LGGPTYRQRRFDPFRAPWSASSCSSFFWQPSMPLACHRVSGDARYHAGAYAGTVIEQNLHAHLGAANVHSQIRLPNIRPPAPRHRRARPSRLRSIPPSRAYL
jgi:hypothetical protein